MSSRDGTPATTFSPHQGIASKKGNPGRTCDDVGLEEKETQTQESAAGARDARDSGAQPAPAPTRAPRTAPAR
jgi:hypothetical protein